MTSSSPALARRARRPFTTLSLIALTFAAGCGSDGDTPDDPGPATDRQMHEVAGAVQPWPGEAEASCGARLSVEPFRDEVGGRAATETRALITSAQAYRDYFGHTPPPSVNFGRDWVIFYAAGKQPTAAHRAEVNIVGVRGETLHVVTSLSAPVPPCAPPVPGNGGASGNGAGGTTGSGMTTPADPGNAGNGSSSSSGSAGAGAPTMPAPDSPTPAPAPGSTAPAIPQKAPPPMLVPPSPPQGRDYLPYALVKIPAQMTRSVEFQHQNNIPRCGGDPLPNPCAAVLCGPGQTCVVLESYPPQARCVPVPTPPPGCVSSAQCSDGLVCSTELGICGSNPSCRPNAPCDAACWGVCMKKPEPSARCTSSDSCPRGSRCSTERGDCQGCGAGPGVACPAVCFGVCEPTPTEMCTGGVLMGGCRSEDAIKNEAVEICRKSGLVLHDFAVGEACFAGGFNIAKYRCCATRPTPPPPPPPPPAAVCKADSDCRLSSSECGQDACTCSAQPVVRDAPTCAVPAIACLVDPCARLQAACVSGQCVMRRQ